MREVTALSPKRGGTRMRRVYAVAISFALLVALFVVNPVHATADPGSPATHRQLLRYVIARGLSQRGVPFVWGGGNAAGATRGTDPAADAVGFGPGATTTLGPGTTTLGPGATTILSPGAATVSPAAGTVGFDASGLMVYAFAGAGIKLPRTSGEQCNVGRKVLPAQARPGDLICYGPGGSQSVAMYLGNGQMLEATEPVVMVSAVRTGGMTPYLTRIIES